MKMGPNRVILKENDRSNTLLCLRYFRGETHPFPKQKEAKHNPLQLYMHYLQPKQHTQFSQSLRSECLF